MRGLLTSDQSGPAVPHSTPVTMTACLCDFDFEDVISQDAESCVFSHFSVAFSLCFLWLLQGDLLSSQQHVPW